MSTIEAVSLSSSSFSSKFNTTVPALSNDLSHILNSAGTSLEKQQTRIKQSQCNVAEEKKMKKQTKKPASEECSFERSAREAHEHFMAEYCGDF